MYRLIMFDLDGTLLNSYDSIANTFNDTLVHFGIAKASDEDMAEMIGPRVYDTFRGRFGRTHEEAMEMTEWFRNDYEREHMFEAELYPGIVGLLEELRSNGIRTVIVTNKRQDFTESLADRYGLVPLMDGMYGIDSDNTLRKHQLIEKCLRDFHCSPEHSVMVGDTGFDRDAAMRCNVNFVPVSYGFGRWDIESCKDAGELSEKLLG